ncbi:Glycosyltransferase family 10 (fucosyltransferase) C-term [Idiomarinaceae bacterium HL-53]|nr:Glycosyltransferase family 10 (fucosyltransferase) C-term [Idiomarinaceae bacterium HL-53]
MIVSQPQEADLLISGALRDFLEHQKIILRCKQNNSRLKCMVFSEEPFWDWLWDPCFGQPIEIVGEGSEAFEVYRVNHTTSDVFKFETLPYFITTEDYFFERYRNWFLENARLTPKDWIEKWNSAPFEFAYVAEKRVSDKFAVEFPELAVFALCQLRTRLAQLARNRGQLVEGNGWGHNRKRQDLDDWHLDKYQLLKGQSKFVSALENTDQKFYVTEKLFDAYAVGGIPLYSIAPRRTDILKLVPPESLINTFGRSAPDIDDYIRNNVSTKSFSESYATAQEKLNSIFSRLEELEFTRNRFAARFLREITKVMNS